jgi:hypothetical protein
MYMNSFTAVQYERQRSEVAVTPQKKKKLA